ncbi:cation:proton antiporter [Candidatus Woesearchaeota archaeon]|nr:cation:proton antiporter [Candidatus Woesearchaeota archaeon]
MVEEYLIYFAMVLLLGTLVSALASKLKISNVFFLVFAGMVLGSFGFINFPNTSIIIISTLAMIIVIFDSTVKLKFRDIEKFSSYGMRLVLIFFFLNIIVLSASVYYLFDVAPNRYGSVVLIVVFSALMFGLDHDPFLEQFNNKKNKIYKLLEVESLLNRPLTLIAPLILLNYVQDIFRGVKLNLGQEFLVFFQHISLGLVVGLISGTCVYFILNTKIKDQLSYLIVIAGSILTFIVSEQMNASGVLALTVFALVFGNYHIKHKLALEKFTSIFGYIFNIFVFILIGTILLIDFKYLLKGTILYLIYIVIRFVSVNLALIGSKFTFKNRLLMTLSITKGIDVSIIILIMITRFNNIEGMNTIINLSLLFCLYSFIITNITNIFYKKLLTNE